MGTITTTQPGTGNPSFTGNGTVLMGSQCNFVYAGATATCTWTTQAKPGGSGAAVIPKGINASLLLDVAGSYTVRFTDSASANTDVVLTAVAATSSLGNFASGGSIGTAPATVDQFSSIDIAQTTGGQTLTLPTPSDTSNGKEITINNTGSQSFTMLGATIAAGASMRARWTGAAWSKFS